MWLVVSECTPEFVDSEIPSETAIGGSLGGGGTWDSPPPQI